MSGAPDEFREKLFQEVRVLDDRISAEETELFEKRMEMEEFLQDRRRSKVVGCRASDGFESGVARKAASRARGSNAEVGHSNVPEVDVNWKGTREDQKFRLQC